MWIHFINILEWFGEYKERNELVRNFNASAKKSFTEGKSATLLSAKVTLGDKSFKHSFSKFLASGFRIKALSGKPLSKSELIAIGKIILDDENLVRRLISLGWDTLEIHDNYGLGGCKWALKDYGKLGGLIN